MMQHAPRQRERPVASTATADVCLIVEGAYPYVAGGVSSWVDWLMRTQPRLSFHVVAIVADHAARTSRYPKPDNLVGLHDLVLGPPQARGPRRGGRVPHHAPQLAAALAGFVNGGGLAEFSALIELLRRDRQPLSLPDLMETPLALDVVSRMYEELMPHASFLQFYWAWRALCGGLLATLQFELPPAGCYHTISTGYAGLLAARAAVETGRPALITEHGIYTNERRIEILMAEWIADTVDKGLDLDDGRMDLRDLWIRSFESYARACYQACRRITTLYGDNQEMQLALGAAPERLMVIANGIDVERFAALEVAPPQARPTMALIGRVVPIKDTQSFIAAAAEARRRFPDLRALVMGPTDEDPAYVAECRQLVGELGLGDCVEFTGAVRITDWLAQIHVVVLTSLSEAQPLVLLEAGAAGIPCVAANVGACREILEGAGTADDPHEAGGFVTDLVDPGQVAERVCQLLASTGLRRQLGEALRRRVGRCYATDIARARYAALYAEAAAPAWEAR